jgi:hypothetical protein
MSETNWWLHMMGGPEDKRKVLWPDAPLDFYFAETLNLVTVGGSADDALPKRHRYVRNEAPWPWRVAKSDDPESPGWIEVGEGEEGWYVWSYTYVGFA